MMDDWGDGEGLRLVAFAFGGPGYCHTCRCCHIPGCPIMADHTHIGEAVMG
jgi:hypothetical protein